MFRTLSVLALLFIAESVPSFGSILGLVGASTVTMLTFVCPPYFYLRLSDSSKDNKEWTPKEVPLWERIYCWVLIVVGFAGKFGWLTPSNVLPLFDITEHIDCLVFSR